MPRLRSAVQTRLKTGKHRKYSPSAVKKQPVSATRFCLPRVTRRVHSEAERRLFFKLCPVEGTIKWDEFTREYNFRVSEALRESQGASNVNVTDLALKQKKHLIDFARGIVEQQVVDMSLGTSADLLTRFQVLQRDLHEQRFPTPPLAVPTRPTTVPSSGADVIASTQSPCASALQTPAVRTGSGLHSNLGEGRPPSTQRPFAFMRPPAMPY